MNEPSTTTAELDAQHAEARAAFEARDLSRYRAIFAPELRYRQANGRVIGREELMKDVSDQFRKLDRVSSRFTREQIEFDGDRAIETLTQIAWAGVTAFLIVHRAWEVIRKARYTWRKLEGRWCIEEVEILDERVVPRRVWFGFRPLDH